MVYTTSKATYEQHQTHKSAVHKIIRTEYIKLLPWLRVCIAIELRPSNNGSVHDLSTCRRTNIVKRPTSLQGLTCFRWDWCQGSHLRFVNFFNIIIQRVPQWMRLPGKFALNLMVTEINELENSTITNLLFTAQQSLMRFTVITTCWPCIFGGFMVWFLNYFSSFMNWVLYLPLQCSCG